MRRILIACLLLAACGGSTEAEIICQRLASWDPASKQGDCQNQLRNLYSEPHCLAGIAACSDADHVGLNSYNDCLDALPVCSHATEGSWESLWWACQDKLLRVNANCVGAL